MWREWIANALKHCSYWMNRRLKVRKRKSKFERLVISGLCRGTIYSFEVIIYLLLAECLSQALVPLAHYPERGTPNCKWLFTAFCRFLTWPHIWVWFGTWRAMMSVQPVIYCPNQVLFHLFLLCLNDCLGRVFSFLQTIRSIFQRRFSSMNFPHKTKLRRHRLATVHSKG